MPMRNEIERKFFVRDMPDLSGLQPLRYERYILNSAGERKECRITRIGERHYLENKRVVSDIERSSEKKEISKDEFERLKREAGDAIIRDKYVIGSGNDSVSLQVYHGRFEGLVRAEIEFESEERAKRFVPPSWMGKEMTGLAISRDATLSKINMEAFARILSETKQTLIDSKGRL